VYKVSDVIEFIESKRIGGKWLWKTKMFLTH
jgi:hypothetical protein